MNIKHTLEDIDSQIGLKEEALITRANLLKRDADRILFKVQHGEGADLNGIGELQGSGDRIDVLCAQITELYRIRKLIASIEP